ncbi:prephenate dehydrogenase [Natronorarus salvus]|uniref:prephenate dehydrogenase n=1 Tax=Natronorarus salvus TaxID=3117733 RepID=UPI002F26C1CB
MRLLIVGAGAMGRWFAAAVATGVDEIAFADVDHAAAQAAAEAQGGRAVAIDGEEGFDALCVAVPLSIAPTAIEEHASRAGAAVFDVSGAMTEPVNAMRAAASDRERASLHPLFAPENEPGNVPVVVDESGAITEEVLSRIEARGNALVETTPEEHDRAMETVQAKVHAAVLAYALARDPVPEGFETPVSRGLDDLVETVTGGTPHVYGEIQGAFDGAESVASAAERIAASDGEAFEALYREASEGAIRYDAGDR